MPRRKKGDPIQIEEGKWYAVNFGKPPFQEECCHCGLVHNITYSIKNGRIFVQYAVDHKATGKARQRMVRDGVTMPVLPSRATPRPR